jgi:hypothetical protein
LSKSDTNGWIKLESATSEIEGFFLIFDKDLNLLDGANCADVKLTDFVFTEVRTDGYNKISVINNNPGSTTVDFLLVRADGTVRSSKRKVISGNGAQTVDLFDDLFAGFAPRATDYLHVKSSEGVQPLQVMRQGSDDIATLAGQDITSGATVLYPQYVLGGDYRATLSVINMDSRAGTVRFRMIGEVGVQIGATRTIAIPAKGKA